MAETFDTEHTDRRYKAPPKGMCRVCTEGPSALEPSKVDGRSYRLIGLFSPDEADKAVRTCNVAQTTLNAEAIAANKAAQAVVAFDANGTVIARGTPFAPAA